ncbi:MAG: hypothetical protein IJT15_04195 [Rickettsiales bacterium]|nr:hypothetical protein [Rickettsiales bacterium]
MNCLTACFQTNTEENNLDLQIQSNTMKNNQNPDEQAKLSLFTGFYNSVNKLILDLKNVKLDKPLNKPNNTENTFKAIEKITKEHDDQKKDIDNMRKAINTIANNVAVNNEIKDIVKLKKIEDEDELENAFNKVADNLKEVITKLQRKVQDNKALTQEKDALSQGKQEAENKLNGFSASLDALKNDLTSDETLKDIIDDAVDNLESLENTQDIKQKLGNAFDNIKQKIDDDKKTAEVLAKANILGNKAPNNLTNLNDEGFIVKQDLYGRNVKVNFLTHDCKKMKKNDIETGYNLNNYDAVSYYVYNKTTDKYDKLNNLTGVNMKEDEIILAFQKNS